MSDLDGLLSQGRAAHEELLIDACTITRASPPTLNRTTSVQTPGTSVPLYSGKCRLKAQRMPRDAQAGEELQVVARYELALPFGLLPPSALRVGDVVTMTSSADPRLIGQVLHVLAVDYGSTATAWRITVQDLT